MDAITGEDIMTREQWAKLTPEKQRIKVAVLCGWDVAEYTFLTGVPDYLNDLNAMHEAEKLLTPSNMIALYAKELDDIIATTEGNRPLWNATAAQRAEAFALTMDV